MQTERVTFLTTPDHKAAIDACATRSGRSVGHILREASTRYIEQSADQTSPGQEEALQVLAAELDAAVPQMQASLQRSNEALEALHADMDDFFRARGIV